MRMRVSPATAAPRTPRGKDGRPTASGRMPKYLQIKAALMSDICAGRFPPGSCLPSENDLANSFQASRVTVRMALDCLREAELVQSHQGKGYFVRNLKAVQDLGRLQGFGEIMAPLGVAARSEVLSAATVAAPPEAAAALALERGAPVVKIERLRIAADVAMSMDVSYFPPAIGEVLLGLDLANVDVFTLIETRLGIEIGFADITMDVVAADETVRARLGVPPGERLIRIERLTHEVGGRPIDFEYLYGRPETHRFKLRAARW
ncbi:GntR family transcriptional regulator [Azospirillum sp. ST 5-10]|uniref:GntR family transcriptional regulator n=1 Tax=unclassified Azospirillum TaxID=2630922 RepID=UPI003F4A3D00